MEKDRTHTAPKTSSKRRDLLAALALFLVGGLLFSAPAWTIFGETAGGVARLLGVFALFLAIWAGIHGLLNRPAPWSPTACAAQREGESACALSPPPRDEKG